MLDTFSISKNRKSLFETNACRNLSLSSMGACLCSRGAMVGRRLSLHHGKIPCSIYLAKGHNGWISSSRKAWIPAAIAPHIYFRRDRHRAENLSVIDVELQHCARKIPSGMRLSRGRQLRLHEKLCAGDRTASAQIFDALLGPLVGVLRKKWPEQEHSELVRDTAIDSIASYVENPLRFDPSRMSLLSFLAMDAHGDLTNTYQRETAAAKQMQIVAAREASRNGHIDEYPSDREPPDLTMSQLKTAFPDQRDRQAILLLIEGETATSAYATAWGITGSPEEQAKNVKRNKDRVKARIKRLRK